MTEEGNGSASSSLGRRNKRGRKRNANKRNDSKRQGGGSASKNKKTSSTPGNNHNSGTVPPPPQIKITIRNIKNSDKLDSVTSVLEQLVAKLMEACVENKSNNQYTIELDRSAVRYLITEEEQINKHRLQELARIEEEQKERLRELARIEKEKENEIEGETNENNSGVNEEKENTGEIADSSTPTEMVIDDRAETIVNKSDELDIILAPKVENNLPTIVARPLYVVPPRKTSRRGERAGVVCMLLIAPKINHGNSSPSSPPNVKKKGTENVGKEELIEPATEASDPPNEIASNSNLMIDENSHTPTTVSMGRETSVAAINTFNHPRELAKGRLLLSNTIQSLSQLAAADSKSLELFSGCIVEQSLNGKTWKTFQNKSRPDRREGTITSTVDYKAWLESLEKQKEELKARPKPVPGGGSVANANTAATAGGEIHPNDDNLLEENGQPVSSLVHHLRLKKQEEKRNKKVRKNKKDDNTSKKAKKIKDGRSDENKNKVRINKDGSGKKKKAAKKEKRRKKAAAAKKKASKASALKQPTALLKPRIVASSVSNTKS